MSDAPIRIGHPDRERDDGLCGCCEGTELSTPRPIANRPSLTAIAYRAGKHADFKASMLTSLASAAHPALRDLGTRDDDDFTIALIDAWATVCEVLGFYQERHANEAYIGTARERLSVGEIARLIGYELHPGAAAETDLVFVMDDPPASRPDVTGLSIPVATRVQSQPGPDEKAQLFETLAPLMARVSWNRLRPRRNRRMAPELGDTGTWLEGQATALRPGDAVLIVGRQRGDPSAPDHDPGSELWDFHRIVRVDPDRELDRTRVEWERPLGSVTPPGRPAQGGQRFFALRDRAALFGQNAPHPLVLTEATRDGFGYTDEAEFGSSPSPSKITGTRDNPLDWSFEIDIGAREVVLDAVHESFVENSWVVLTLPAGLVELYRIEHAQADGVSKYAISGKATRLALDSDEGLTSFHSQYRKVAAFGGSEEIGLADTPLFDWVSGAEIELDGRAADLPRGRRLMLTGLRAQVEVAVREITLLHADASPRTVAKGARLTLTAPPEEIAAAPGGMWLWNLVDADGFTGAAEAPEDALIPVAADESAGTIAEAATLERVAEADPHHSRLILEGALSAAFDRRDLSIHANVVPASHGESATEILGGGDPSRPFQSFTLSQNPVTQRIAATENGVASTLEVRVDGVAWEEVPHLHGRRRNARVFATRLTDAGETEIRFGDGRSGARPPAGRDNIVADYRKGLGRAGNVQAGQLSLPLDRPLGLKKVTNPLAAKGGDDPEAHSDARHNAPIYTLTLGRVVSVTDYRDFALGYPGISKADARWVWGGWTRRIVVSVAGSEGAVVAEGSATHSALVDALREFGDPFVQYDLISYEPAHFRIAAKVAIDPAFETELVLADVEAALREGFSFESRAFAQPVALSHVVEIMHGVPGVRAVDVDRLYRESPPQTTPIAHALLAARTSRLGPHGSVLPAEVLTLSPDPFDALEPMS